jgi:hypothetical protein
MLKPLAFQDAHVLADTIREIGLVKAGDRIRDIRRVGLLLQAISDYCGMPRVRVCVSDCYAFCVDLW